MTMTLVQTITVGSGGAASIDFTGIPATGTDLIALCSLRGVTSSNNIIQVQLNNITTTSYTNKQLRGESGVSSTSWSGVPAFVAGLTAGTSLTANTFTSVQVYVPNYTSTTVKSFSSEYSKETNDATYYENGISAGLLTTSSPVTSFKLSYYGGGTIAEYSSISLYTITKGSGGATVS